MAAVFLTAFGMHGTLAFLFPTTICAIVLLAFNKRFLSLGIAKNSTTQKDAKPERWGNFALAMGVLSCRSIVEYGLMAFIPLFFVSVLGQGETFGSLMLSVFAIAGAVATAISGRITERAGVFRIAYLCFGILALCLVAFAFNRSLVSAVVLVCLLTCAANLFYPSFVALGMSYVPRHLGTASGISYGVVICVGGIVEPLLGMAGDAYGLPLVMLIIAGVTVIGLGMVAIVKRHN